MIRDVLNLEKRSISPPVVLLGPVARRPASNRVDGTIQDGATFVLAGESALILMIDLLGRFLKLQAN